MSYLPSKKDRWTAETLSAYLEVPGPAWGTGMESLLTQILVEIVARLEELERQQEES